MKPSRLWLAAAPFALSFLTAGPPYAEAQARARGSAPVQGQATTRAAPQRPAHDARSGRRPAVAGAGSASGPGPRHAPAASSKRSAAARGGAGGGNIPTTHGCRASSVEPGLWGCAVTGCAASGAQRLGKGWRRSRREWA